MLESPCKTCPERRDRISCPICIVREIYEDAKNKEGLKMSLENQIYNIIKENNGKLDLVDIACKFPEIPCNMPPLAVTKLEEAGMVERRQLYGAQWAYFVRN